MNKRTVLTNLLATLAILLSGVGISTAAQVLYDSSGFIVGQQSFSDSFNVSGPGTLTVTLTNMAWPEPLASLNSVVSTSDGLLGAEMSAGTETFNVSGGPVFVQWFGSAQGALDAGVYGLNVQYQANGSGGGPNPVPLPTSSALFLSGLALLFWQRRVRARSVDEPLPTA
jgi:hypothetical protein